MGTEVFSISVKLSFGFLILALLFALIRLIRGPRIQDRIAAMDLIASIVIGFILVYSLFIQRGLYMDIAIVIAVISFVGTVAISSYLKQKTN